MINPWNDIPSVAPLVLPGDRESVEQFNARQNQGSPYRLDVTSVVPEPFIGNVASAPVIVLQLNPGLDPATDPDSHADPEFRQALLANLRHDPTDFPFYFFDPRLRDSHPGGRWWTTKTKQLVDEVPISKLASCLAVVEWFPYKSQKYKDGCSVQSQSYGLFLVARAIRRKALIVVARSNRRWEAAIPLLASYERKLTLSSNQNVSLLRNNLKLNGVKTPEAWRVLIDALHGCDATSQDRGVSTAG